MMKSKCSFHSLVSTQSCCSKEKQPQLGKHSGRTGVKQNGIQNSTSPILYGHKSTGPESFNNCLLIVLVYVFVSIKLSATMTVFLLIDRNIFEKFQLPSAPTNSLVKSDKLKGMDCRTKEI